MPVPKPTPAYPEFREAVAQDAIDRNKVPLVGAREVEFILSTVGPIFRSPDGTRWRVTVDNLGRYLTEAVT